MIDSTGNQGQTVKLVSKSDIIAEHKSKSTANEPFTSESHFVYFKREPPCSKPLSSLRRAFLKDLKLGWDSGYHDAVVVLRTIAPPRRFGDALQTVTEDEQGNCIYLRFYGPIAGVHVDHFLPEGSVVAVKAPWCKSNRVHGTAIVVKYLTDFVCLAQGGILYPAKWNLIVPPSAPSASEWFKEEGNCAYKSQKYQTAVVRYTEALNFKPNETLEITIYSNRAQAHLASGAFEAAIADTTFVLSREPQHEKSLYCCAMGHYYMQNYVAAIELLNSLIQAYPSNEIAKKDLQRATQRRREQTTGAYDFAEMLKVSRGPSPQMDVADYIGPVEQRAGGIFATRDISVGELLMCTKAFEFVYSNNSDKGVFFNNHVSGASTLRLSKKIAQKLASNPSFIPSFKKLHPFPSTIAGNISDELVDGRPVIDE
ncbi:TPR-like protein [Rickenella mellea]|uniref:TPR-like protein n=1 Tax=Rickenella mellea TaxID=50990 RepID=A0A4Y7PRC0_9AGAM|nr:TPR-like protein [Rickenella mellea]